MARWGEESGIEVNVGLLLLWLSVQAFHYYLKKIWGVIGVICLLVPLIWFNVSYFSRPPQVNEQRSLFPGIVYRREVRSLPRPMVIHLAEIDLTAPGIGVFVTPAVEKTPETTARTVSQFVTQFNLQLAINANFFYPFYEETPWDYFPQVGDRVESLGQVISNGNAYSPGDAAWDVICFAADNRAQIIKGGFCPTGTIQAVAGNQLLVENGQLAQNLNDPQDKPYPRVVVAIDRTGQKLWVILVDGKQRLYSEGMTIAELAKFVQQLGVDRALNLDGGGSTTLVMGTRLGAKVLNAPIHTKVPMRERPVANQLGFYALPDRSL
ncbi:phosphodiester glycosidase family protein [Phormidesmis sp. 146-35]